VKLTAGQGAIFGGKILGNRGVDPVATLGRGNFKALTESKDQKNLNIATIACLCYNNSVTNRNTKMFKVKGSTIKVTA